MSAASGPVKTLIIVLFEKWQSMKIIGGGEKKN